MRTPRLFRMLLALSLLIALVATGSKSVSAYESKEPAAAPAQGNDLPGNSLILVNGQTLTGPNSSAQQRGGRLFLPVAAIAQALGDVVKSDAMTRMVTVRRQNGVVADFNAQLSQVRENGAVTLTSSGSTDLIFPPGVQDLMLPAEIVAALLDVSVRRDEGQAIRVTRGGVAADTVRAGEKSAKLELYQLEFDYGLNYYSSLTNHNLTLRGTGRLGDSRFTFLGNLISASNFSRPVSFQGGSVTLERPNGQTFVVGDLGTGTDLQFLSTTVRGVAAELPVGGMRLNLFGGRAISGQLDPIFFDPITLPGTDPEPIRPRSTQLNFDTTVVGGYVTSGGFSSSPNGRDLLFSAGGMHFSSSNRRGDLVTGSMRYGKGRARLQADVAAGMFEGRGRDNDHVDGVGAAVNLSGSLQLNDQLIVQGRYAYVGPNFLGVQSGAQEPINLASGGVVYKPARWLTASFSASSATRPGRDGDPNRFGTATVNITPGKRWPTLFVSHTQTSTPQLKNASFTLASVAKDFTRWRLFVNATRVKTFGPAFINAQAGASLRINESNTVEVGQAFGSGGLLNGQASYQIASLLGRRLSLNGGAGYMRSNTSPLRFTEQVSASLRLPRESQFQVSYLRTQTGPTLLINLRGLILNSRRGEQALSGPVANVTSYGSVYGRVYQDLNLNGKFDAGVDQPQANVQVRVDGSRYVETGPEGTYRIDSVERGQHAVNLDLLSVRADLTMLDGAEQQVSLESAHDSVVDFRLVRTGRISGQVWQDVNENGRLDDGETPLGDVRIVTGSGRDTLTDANGYFMIGDLPPGEVVVLVDEKTLPELTRSGRGSLAIKVQAGNETADVLFPVTAIPAEVKRFGNK